MMTLREWQKKTTRVGKKRDNPLVTDVDILLRNFHSHTANDATKVKYAILIRHYCNEWLHTKTDKKKSFRRSAFEALKRQTEAFLKSGAGVQGTIDRYRGVRGSGVRAGKTMEEHMLEVLQPRAPSAAKANLQAGLTFERMSAHVAEDSLVTHAQGDATDLVTALDTLQDLMRRHLDPNDGTNIGRTLRYLDRTERQAYLMHFAGVTASRGANPAPYTSPDFNTWQANPNDGFVRRDIYAMDQMDHIYVAPGNTVRADEFHHSSFLAGKPVKCAGEIIFGQGALRYISNESGHYRPATQNLIDAVTALRDTYGLDLTGIRVADLQTALDWGSAHVFLNRRGRRPPQMPGGNNG